jgi:CHAT domain-containing protein
MSRLYTFLTGTAVILGTLGSAAPASESVSSVDSFRIGSTGVLCTAQSLSSDPRFATMFDRGYDIVCRDAATPVGRVYALKAKKQTPDRQLDDRHAEGLSCKAAVPVEIKGLVNASKADCIVEKTGLNYSRYSVRRSDIYFETGGFAAYDSALRLGLISVVSDRPVEGEISVATTNAGDPAAFAKVQAASLDPEQALSAGYGRSNEGSFAEASEFFEALVGRSRTNEKNAGKAAEYLANQAIQQSNLGNRAEADRLFTEASKAADSTDPIFRRLFRNLQAMHRLNGRDADGALAILDAPVPVVIDVTGLATKLEQGVIDRKLSQRLAVDDAATSKLGGAATRLTETERATLMDAQSLYLQGVAYRLKQKFPQAKSAFDDSMAAYASVRGGNVVSMSWLLASASTELSQIAEAENDLGRAKSYLQQAAAIYQAQYPESATALAAKGRLAGLQARHGEQAIATETFRQLVHDSSRISGGSDALRSLIKPYFDALVTQQGPQAADDFLAASQAMVRPGVAQTQAVLARELSGGSDEASSLFRQSITLTREIVSTDVEIARLSAIETRTPAEEEALSKAQVHRQKVGAEQTTLLAKLAAFPKFRVMSNSRLELKELQQGLRANEGYYKLLLVGEAAYGILVEPDNAKIFKIEATRAELESMTNKLRDSIVVEEANQLTTKPFDAVLSHALYKKLFGPVQDRVAAIKHLVFEPDGPLLKLPANVLVMEQAGVDAYLARQKESNPDEFDFTGVAWLGRDRIVSTAVSAQSFLDVRKIPASKAKRRYLGVGQNTPVEKLSYAPKTEEGRDPCDWGLSLWSKPISGAELILASKQLGGDNNLVITEAEYSDTMLRERSDLKDFQIIQFATHGLVTAPHPGCPARPALVTSFGERGSDGLLSFKEIFDLKLDADTIILSACDTAGAATAAATREAGITTGGNFALDGLVRAFVGAGARAVVASHWPVPDDYNATKKLMAGLYDGSTTRSVGEAMRSSQIKLMDDPLTSHPYYWAAFAIVGDASKPLTTDNSQIAARAEDQVAMTTGTNP